MTYNELWRQLTQVYDDYEAKAIARMVYEVRFGLMPSDLFIGKDTQLSTDDQKLLAEITQRLLTGEPIQYVLGEAREETPRFSTSVQVADASPARWQQNWQTQR